MHHQMLFAPLRSEEVAYDLSSMPPPGVMNLEDSLPVTVTYQTRDSSVYFDGVYVTRAVPGRILWKLINELAQNNRNDFTNKELRRHPAIALPRHRDNLETRLFLLRNRLAEKFPFVRMFRTGRGRFRFELDRPMRLRVAG